MQQGLGACREVAGSPLPSVRQKHEEHVKTAMANLQRLDEALKGISEEVNLAAHEDIMRTTAPIVSKDRTR